MVVVSEANMNDGWATIFRTKRTANIIGVCWSDAQSMLYKAVRFVPETSRGTVRGGTLTIGGQTATGSI